MAKEPKNKRGKAKRRKTNDDSPFSSLEKLREDLVKSEEAPSTRARRERAIEAQIPTPEPFNFDTEMEDVQPIRRERPRVTKRPKKKPITIPPPPDEDEKMLRALGLWIDKKIEFQIAQDSERIEGAVSGLNPKTRKRLRQGAFSVQAHLDLHGLDSLSAHEATQSFILDAIKNNLRCVLIVHGKGLHSKTDKPILKTAMKKWLTRGTVGRCILAFTTAQPCDGGHGAIYVLLRAHPAQGDGKKVHLLQE